MRYTLLFLLLPFVGLTQTTVDSIKISWGNSVTFASNQLITAGENTVGDTLRCFVVTDNVKINGVTVIEKGAIVSGVVRESTTFHAIPKKEQKNWEAFGGNKSGGQLIIDFVSVKAIDGSDIYLNDCQHLRIGGESGGLAKKQPAFIANGQIKNCITKQSDTKVAVRK